MSTSNPKWRFEYSFAISVIDGESRQRQWHLFIDSCTESNELLTHAEALPLVPEGHPASRHLRFIFMDTHDRLIVHPYEPFFGTWKDEFIDRILALPECCQLNSTSGRTWMHHPGDSAR